MSPSRLTIGTTLLGLAIAVVAPTASLAGQTDRPYQAQWIWSKVEYPKPFQFVRFHKTIELASRPAAATAYITADTFYRLWINGQLVMHGPAQQPRQGDRRSGRGRPVSEAGREHPDDRGLARHLSPSRPWPKRRDCCASWRRARAANGRSWRPPTPLGRRARSPLGAGIRCASATSGDGWNSSTRG